MSSGKDKKKVRRLWELPRDGGGRDEDGDGTAFDRFCFDRHARGGPVVIVMTALLLLRPDGVHSFAMTVYSSIFYYFSCLSRCFFLFSFFLFSPYLLLFLLRPSRSIVLSVLTRLPLGSPNEQTNALGTILFCTAVYPILFDDAQRMPWDFILLYCIVLYFIVCCVFTIC